MYVAREQRRLRYNKKYVFKTFNGCKDKQAITKQTNQSNVLSVYRIFKFLLVGLRFSNGVYFFPGSKSLGKKWTNYSCKYVHSLLRIKMVSFPWYITEFESNIGKHTKLVCARVDNTRDVQKVSVLEPSWKERIFFCNVHYIIMKLSSYRSQRA